MSASSNARWLVLIQGFKVVLQLASLTVLTRLLPPSDYGLIAMAFTATNLANLLRDLGLSSAIIQKRELTERARSTIFWLHLATGMLLACALLLLSGPVAAAYRQPGLASVLACLAVTFPMGSLSAVHQALLERDSRFRTLARIEIVASGIGLLVTVAAALLGAGVYSFVAQSFAVTVLYGVQSWLAVPWRPARLCDRAELRALVGYSGNLSAFNLVNFLARNADSAIIGRALGPAALGAYAMAYKLMLFPLQNLTHVASRAMFPLLSRRQDSHGEAAALYQRAVAMAAALALPIMAGMHTLREPLARLAFGGQWSDVPAVLAWLAPVGAMQSIVSSTGGVFMAKGRTDLLFKLGLFSSALAIGAFVLGIPGGVVGVASMYCLASAAAFVPPTWLACRCIELPYGRFLAGLLPTLACTALCLPAMHLVHRATAAWGDLATLAAAAAAGAAVYLGAYAALFRRQLVPMLHAMLGARLAGRLARRGGAPLRRTWLFVDVAPDFGGHEVMLLRWLEEWQTEPGQRAVLVCLRGSRLAQAAAPLCATVTLVAPGPGQGRAGRLLFLGRLALLLARLRLVHRPEVAVVAEGCLLAQRLGLYASRAVGLRTVLYVPLVERFGAMGFDRAEALERTVRQFYGRLPHAWLTITDAQAAELKAWAGVCQPVFTLPNTVAAGIERRAGQAIRPAGGAAGGPMRVLVLGRLEHHQKGLDLLLDHLVRHPGLAGEFVVHFAGEGPYAEVLHAARQRHPHLQQLIEVGRWSSPADLFLQHDALLMPSRFEGVPLVMLEAMACGLPVVATDLAGTRPYLTPSCLFPLGRLDLAFDTLRRMRQSRHRASRIARRNVAAFTRQASGAAFASAVRQLTGQLQHALHAAPATHHPRPSP